MTTSGRPVAARAAALLVGVAAAFALAMAVPPGQAAAAGTSGAAAPSVTPVHPGPDGYFEYSLAPGATTTGALVVTNRSGHPATYELYAAAASTSPETGVAYGQPTSAKSGTAGWLDVSQPTVTLAPGASTTVSFGVTVPSGTSPGQHVAAITAQAPTPSAVTTGSATGANAAGSSVAIVTTTRVVVAVVVDVPGPAAVGLNLGSPRVDAPRHLHQALAIPMASTGGLLTKPVLAGSVRPCGSPGARALDAVHRQLGTVVPHTAIHYPWYLNHPLSVGCYAVALRLAATGVTRARFTGDIQVGPAQAVGGEPAPHPLGLPFPLAAVDLVALVLVLTAFAYALRRGRRRRAVHRRPRARHAPPSRTLRRAA